MTAGDSYKRTHNEVLFMPIYMGATLTKAFY